MNRALLFFCAFLAFSLFLVPSIAEAKKNQTGQPDIKVKLPKEWQDKEDAFEKARKKLNREQKKLIEEMEVNFVSTVDPDLQILKLASNLEACGTDFVNDPKIIEKFNNFRAKSNERQVIIWGTFDQKYYPQVDFMDHKMLREHLVIKFKIAMNVGAQMIKIQAGQFDKGQQCENAKATLDLEDGAQADE